jgi:hypothetical protein
LATISRGTFAWIKRTVGSKRKTQSSPIMD